MAEIIVSPINFLYLFRDLNEAVNLILQGKKVNYYMVCVPTRSVGTRFMG